ncbi:uncharacterized protein LOC106706558 [Latimeria chalumnae]|uniref:uncharacterized protein LOC106706558 n=1 Tax=Latimeria chalumnae TaxID=7897 RepID=UPI00313B0228
MDCEISDITNLTKCVPCERALAGLEGVFTFMGFSFSFLTGFGSLMSFTAPRSAIVNGHLFNVSLVSILALSMGPVLMDYHLKQQWIYSDSWCKALIYLECISLCTFFYTNIVTAVLLAIIMKKDHRLIHTLWFGILATIVPWITTAVSLLASHKFHDSPTWNAPVFSCCSFSVNLLYLVVPGLSQCIIVLACIGICVMLFNVCMMKKGDLGQFQQDSYSGLFRMGSSVVPCSTLLLILANIPGVVSAHLRTKYYYLDLLAEACFLAPFALTSFIYLQLDSYLRPPCMVPVSSACNFNFEQEALSRARRARPAVNTQNTLGSGRICSFHSLPI